jgi:hypothetical protein
MGLPLSLTLQHPSEQFQALLPAPRRNSAAPGIDKDYPDGIPGRNPVELIAGLDAILVRDNFGDGQLQFTSNLGHVLTIARMKSLSSSNTG